MELVPRGAHRDPEAVATDPESVAWGTRLFVTEDDPPLMVGWGGFKGRPAKGVIELGYEIAPAEQGRGLATEATRAMLEEAFAAGEVRAVIAHTLAEHNASTRVLEKTGFVFDAEVAEEEVGAVWRWRLSR